MRHDPYSSPWRRIVVALAIAALATVIVAGVVTVGQRDASPSTPKPTATAPSTSHATEAPVQPATDKSLADAGYAFVEAYNLLDISVAVAPGAEFLDDPGRETGR